MPTSRRKLVSVQNILWCVELCPAAGWDWDKSCSVTAQSDLVLLSTSVLSSSLYKLQVLAAVTQAGAAPPHPRLGFWRQNSNAQQGLVQVTQLESCSAALGMCREGIPGTPEEAGTCHDASQDKQAGTG